MNIDSAQNVYSLPAAAPVKFGPSSLSSDVKDVESSLSTEDTMLLGAEPSKENKVWESVRTQQSYGAYFSGLYDAYSAQSQECSANAENEYSYQVEGIGLQTSFNFVPGCSAPILKYIFKDGTGFLANTIYSVIGKHDPDEIPLDDKTQEVADAFDNQYASSAYQSALNSLSSEKLLSRGIVDKCGLTPAELICLRNYTASGYQHVNPALFEKDEQALKELAPIIKGAIEGLAKLPAYKGKVYRGAEMPESFFQQHQVGSVVTYDSFTSTSQKSNRSFQGNTVMVIESKSKGKDVSWLSEYRYEKEVLFPPGTQFCVLQHTEENGRHYIYMREVVTKEP